MTEIIPPTRDALREALELSEVILADIELERTPLSSSALKASRLARLLNEFDMQRVFQLDISGVPSEPDGISAEYWQICELANRIYKKRDSDSDRVTSYAHLESIAQYEVKITAAQQAISAAADRDISISSANPSQYVSTPSSNKAERDSAQKTIVISTRRLSERRSFIHDYVLKKHFELKFAQITDDVFTRIRENADEVLSNLVPDAIQKFNAVHESLESENPENWANAVHSCRRIIENLADSLFPAQENSRVKEINGNKTEIKIGQGNYKNRLLCYVEDRSSSKRYNEIVGSSFEYLSNRLDSIIQATQKGTHDEIVRREEADRYVIYTYMIVNDILSLSED